MHNIIVTGGSGFIGSHLVKKLIRENYKVTVIDRLAEVDGNAPDQPHAKNGVTYYRADIRDLDVLNRIFARENARSCVHLAALISVADSVKDPASTIDVNINGTANVLAACSEHRVNNYVFASTGAAYGEPRQFPITEEHVLDPLSPYGASKVAGESLAASYRNCGKIPNCTSLRFFNVYGEGQSAAYAGVITVFADRLSKGLAPMINGDGLQTRDFVFVEDVANAITLAIEAGEKRGLSGRFNVATGRSITINELAKAMIKIFGLDLEPMHREALAGDVRFAQVDISKTRNALGYSPQSALEDALAEMLRSKVKSVASPA